MGSRNKRITSNQHNHSQSCEPAVSNRGFPRNREEVSSFPRLVSFETSADRDQLLVNTELRRRDGSEQHKNGVKVLSGSVSVQIYTDDLETDDLRSLCPYEYDRNRVVTDSRTRERPIGFSVALAFR